MAAAVHFSKKAELDLVEAQLWYEHQREGLGYQFLLCVEARIDQIARDPRAFQFRYKELRVAFTGRFPYGIHYLLQDDVVLVQAIFHMSRDPNKWEDRS